MEKRVLEITVISAAALRNVRKMGQLKPYVAVYISNNPNVKQQTHVDETGKTNPYWDSTLYFCIGSEFELHYPHVVFKLHCQRTIGGDKFIGEVKVPVKRIFDQAAGTWGSFPVNNTKKGTKGSLKVSFNCYKLVPLATEPPVVIAAAAPVPPEISANHRQAGSGIGSGTGTGTGTAHGKQNAQRVSHTAKAGFAIAGASLAVGVGSLAATAYETANKASSSGGGGGGPVDSSMDHQHVGNVENQNGMEQDPTWFQGRLL